MLRPAQQLELAACEGHVQCVHAGLDLHKRLFVLAQALQDGLGQLAVVPYALHTGLVELPVGFAGLEAIAEDVLVGPPRRNVDELGEGRSRGIGALSVNQVELRLGLGGRPGGRGGRLLVDGAATGKLERSEGEGRRGNPRTAYAGDHGIEQLAWVPNGGMRRFGVGWKLFGEGKLPRLSSCDALDAPALAS